MNFYSVSLSVFITLLNFIFVAMNSRLLQDFPGRIFKSIKSIKSVLFIFFPVIDILFYRSVIDQAKESSRWKVILFKVFVTLILLYLPVKTIDKAFFSKSSIHLVDLENPKATADTFFSQFDGKSLLFTNNTFDYDYGGIWRYDFAKKKATRLFDFFDAHNFIKEDDYFYYFDRTHQLVKKQKEGREKAEWKTLVELADSYFVQDVGRFLIAAGERGKWYLIDKVTGDIKKHNLRVGHGSVDYVLPLQDGRFSFVPPGPFFEIWDENLQLNETVEVLDLKSYPLLRRVRQGRVGNWSFYSRQDDELYLSCIWGQVK
ncbi:MAG: hypothetical protein HRT44_08200, partial [Bdellovibrionales bacterium]|nr:hypothetical protein [Bdellovibrionales bacterium]NQZ19220.1 hypothetical protein [Bdellovibrionales bacterium]